MSRFNYVCLHILKGLKHGEILFKGIACYSVIMQDPYKSVVSCSIVGWLNCSIIGWLNCSIVGWLNCSIVGWLKKLLAAAGSDSSRHQ